MLSPLKALTIAENPHWANVLCKYVILVRKRRARWSWLLARVVFVLICSTQLEEGKKTGLIKKNQIGTLQSSYTFIISIMVESHKIQHTHTPGLQLPTIWHSLICKTHTHMQIMYAHGGRNKQLSSFARVCPRPLINAIAALILAQCQMKKPILMLTSWQFLLSVSIDLSKAQENGE